MRLGLFCHLLLIFSICANAKAETSNNDQIDDASESRVLAQVQNFKKRKVRRKKVVSKVSTYKSIYSPKYKGYKVQEIPQYQIPPLLSREDLNKIIPSGVSATDPSNDVLKKIGDKAVNVWLKSPTMQQVSIVQAAEKVEKAMKAEVDLAPDAPVKQKLNFQVQAFQAVSKVDYTGYVDATISYNMRDQKTGYEIRRKVLHDKDLYVNHTSSKEEKLSTVGLKWSF